MKLSVIIPVYNVEKYLSKCLDSVIHPELEDYEIIAVNDGSTDSSPAILEDYRARYCELIKVIHKENGGQGTARNLGLEAARGEYILFIDSDDYVLPETLPYLLSLCESRKDIYFFDSESVREDGSVISYLSSTECDGDFSITTDPKILLSNPSPCDKMVSRQLYVGHNIRFPARVWYEDFRTIPKLYLWAKSCVRVRKPFYKYLMRSGSTMNNKNIRRNLEIIDAINDLCSYYREHGQYEKYEKELEYLAFYHWYICASVRVCLADSKSPDSKKLRDDFISMFPSYRSNPYVKSAPAKYKLLDRLISLGLFGAVSFIMGLNARLK